MPQFILNTGNRIVTDELYMGYIEALFFAGDDEDGTCNALGVSRLTKAALASIKHDCDKLTGTLMPDGRFARQWIDELMTLKATYGNGVDNDTRAGHMIYYSANGHGVSWDDDYSGDIATRICEGLRKACSRLPSRDMYAQRGWIYLD